MRSPSILRFGLVEWTSLLAALFVTAVAVGVGLSAAGEVDPFGAAALAIGLTVSVGVVTWLVAAAGAHRARRRARAEDELARRMRRESAFRLFWVASGDFAPGGWGRRDLDALRLICRNLEPGAPVGERVARRLGRNATEVLSRVVDRLYDVASTAREIEASRDLVVRLERATREMVRELEASAGVSGPLFAGDPRGVAAASDEAVAVCEELRESVRPRIVSDLGAVVAALGRSTLAARLAAGQLRIDTGSLDRGAARVAVRPSDLSEALGDLLGTVFRLGELEGPVDVRVRHDEQCARIVVTLPVRHRFSLDASALLQPLRALTAYGVTVTLDEEVEEGVVVLDTSIPRADVRLGA